MNTVTRISTRKAAPVIINIDITVEKKVRVATWTALLSCGDKSKEIIGKGKASEAPFKQALLTAVKEIKNPRNKDLFLVVTHNIADFQTWFWKTPNATAILTRLTGYKLTCRLAK